MSSIEELYETYRKPLISYAYRMLGSVMDAEDIVQETFISYGRLEEPDAIRNERSFLYKIVTNRCLDLLRSSAKKRELYVGPWLPEPLIGSLDAAEADPSEIYLRRESISTAYLLLLQQLSAVERAVFLLREIFHYSFDEIAGMVGKSTANCRQIFHRAKKSIQADSEQTLPPHIAEEKLKDFVSSLLQGNTSRLLELVSEGAAMISDGGGKVTAARVPVLGFERVIKLLLNLLQMYVGKYTYSFVSVNGIPGFRLAIDNGDQFVYSFSFKDDKIQSIYALGNPEKLRHLPALEPLGDESGTP